MPDFDRILDQIITEKLKENPKNELNSTQILENYPSQINHTEIVLEPNKNNDSDNLNQNKNKNNDSDSDFDSDFDFDNLNQSFMEIDSEQKTKGPLGNVPDRLTITDLSNTNHAPILALCQTLAEKKANKITNKSSGITNLLSKADLKKKLINIIKIEPSETKIINTIKIESSLLDSITSLELPKIDLNYFEFPKNINFPKFEIPNNINFPKFEIPKNIKFEIPKNIKFEIPKKENTLLDLDFIDDLLPYYSSSNNKPIGKINQTQNKEKSNFEEYTIVGNSDQFEIPSRQFQQMNLLKNNKPKKLIELNLNTPIDPEYPLVYCGQPFKINPILKCNNLGCVRCYTKKLLKQGFTKSFLKKIKEHLEEKYPGKFQPKKLSTHIFLNKLDF